MMPKGLRAIAEKTLDYLKQGVRCKPSKFTTFADVGSDASSRLSTRAAEQSSVAYEGFKTILRGVNDSAVMCPPLKTAAAALLSIITAVDVRVPNSADALH